MVGMNLMEDEKNQMYKEEDEEESKYSRESSDSQLDMKFFERRHSGGVSMYETGSLQSK